MITIYFKKICFEQATSLKDKINKIDLIINALYDQAFNNIGTSGTDSYKLNDGQTIIEKEYKDETEIYKAIELLERQKQRCINQLVGRSTRLVDYKSFIAYR